MRPLGFSPTEIGAARAPVTVFFNGHLFTGKPRWIPLLANAQNSTSMDAR